MQFCTFRLTSFKAQSYCFAKKGKKVTPEYLLCLVLLQIVNLLYMTETMKQLTPTGDLLLKLFVKASF